MHNGVEEAEGFYSEMMGAHSRKLIILALIWPNLKLHDIRHTNQFFALIEVQNAYREMQLVVIIHRR